MNKLYLILPFALTLCFMVGCQQVVKTIEKTTKTEIENAIIIPGTWLMDVDTMRYYGSKERFSASLERSKIKDVDYNSLKFGASLEECDLFWRQGNQTSRSLNPWSGAEFAYLRDIKFEDLTFDDLQKGQYSKEKIIGDDNNNQLIPGIVIGIRTNNGNYAKMRIDGYFPRFSNQEIVENYHLKCTLVLYSNKQELFER